MRMKNIFKRFKSTGILVVGDLMVDQYIWGNVRRISPEAPVPVVEVTGESVMPGGAANVAYNVLSLGGKVFVAGLIGSDDTGKILINKFKEKGLDTEGIFIDNERPTTVKTRVIAHNQQVVRFDKEVQTEINSAIIKMIIEYIKEKFDEIDGIIISDYSKGLITKGLVKKIVELAKGKKLIAVDPKIGHFHYYRDVDLITPNINEASSGSGIEIKDERSLINAGRTLQRKLRCESVVITRGEHGMTLFQEGRKVIHIPTCAREVYDVSGAGDTVVAALTLACCAGATLAYSADIANHAAGIVVGKLGTATATLDEVIDSMKTNKSIQKIIEE